jgi:hypothetical protein
MLDKHAVDKIEIKNRVLCAKKKPLGSGVGAKMLTKRGKLNNKAF